MNTNAHLTESRDLVYAEQVKELLSASSAEKWSDELWTMFDGYIIAQKELGFSPDLPDTYSSFRKLLFFFDRVGKVTA